MKSDIKVPAMGESISTAIISAILKPSGTIVKQGEEIIELETEKVNQPLYALESGKVEYKVNVGDKVTIGQVIGSIDTSVQAPSAGAAPKEAVKEPAKGATAAGMPKPAAPSAPATTAVPAPAPKGTSARQTPADFAASLSQPAASVSPSAASQLPQAPQAAPKTAPQAAAAAQIPASAASSTTTRRRMSGLRRTIAQRLVEVKNQTAMLTTFNEVDMTSVIEIRAREKDNFQKRYGAKLGFMSFFVKAAVAALKAFPDVNSYIEGDEIVTYTIYDVGVAVSTDKGLFVPVIRGCDKLSFGGIESALETYAKKAREGTIAIDDLRGGGFTITNGGVFGSLLSTPILNPPQSAILGMHTIAKRAVVVDDQIVIRPMMYLALSYDHRIIDGKDAVQFLVHIKQDLENPARLLLDL